MTVISIDRPIARSKSQSALNSVLTVIAVGTIIISFYALLTFKEVARLEQNVWTIEDQIFGGFLIGGILYTGFSVLLFFTNSRPFTHIWEAIGNTLRIAPFSLWLMSLALFPLTALTWVNSQPHHLYVKSDMVRVMRDGTVLTSGESIVSNRYQVSSVALPLVQRHELTVPIETLTGAVEMKTEVTFTLDANSAAFKALAKARRTELRTDGVTLANMVKAATIEPAARDIARAVQSGMLSGSEASLITHMGYLIHTRNSRPLWVKELTIHSVSVESWRKEFE